MWASRSCVLVARVEFPLAEKAPDLRQELDLIAINDLNNAVREVCVDQPGKDILLIGGKCDAAPKSHVEFAEVHQTAIVGVHVHHVT